MVCWKLSQADDRFLQVCKCEGAIVSFGVCVTGGELKYAGVHVSE